MKIAYNPKTAAALTTAPANNDITFDLSGLSIYVKGVRFKGTDTTYSVFKKHGSSGGGYDGLVPVPDYNNDSKNRLLKEDGNWTDDYVTLTTVQYIAGKKTISSQMDITNGDVNDDNSQYVRPVIYMDDSKNMIYSDTKANTIIRGSSIKFQLSNDSDSLLLDTSSLKSALPIISTQSITGTTLVSTTTDAAPLTVNSNILVSKLNADLLDGKHDGEVTAAYLKHKYLDAITINNTAGTFAFSGSGEPFPDTDWVGLQVGDNVDKFQISTGPGNTLYHRNNDTGGTNTTDWSPWTQIARVTDNVASATKLQTARTLWGQSFDGTANVDGSLHIYSTGDNWNEGIRMHVSSNDWCGLVMCGADNTGAAGTSANTWSIHNNNGKFYINRNGASNSTGNELCNVDGNWGIGTVSPSHKLHVGGNIYTTAGIISRWAFINTGDSTLKVYDGKITDGYSDGNICLQTSIDETDGQSHSHPTQYGSRCNLVLQPRGGQVYIGTNPNSGDTQYKLYVNGKAYLTGGTINGRLLVNYNVGHSTPAIAINYYDSYTINDTSIAQIKMGTPTYDAYLGLSPASRSKFGKVGYFMHIGSNYEFLWATSDWRKLMALECSTGNLWVNGSVTAAQFISTIATGTKPIQVTSTTLCDNLNADFIDGFHISSIVGGNKSARHGSQGTSYTPDTYSSTFVNKSFAAFAERGDWYYAGNGYISTDLGVNIPLAGTAIFQWGANDINKTQLFITPYDNYGVSNPAANEMIFYTSNGSNYHSAWTRVLTHRNYTTYTVTKTGEGASGTWGINITGSANNLVKLTRETRYAWKSDNTKLGDYTGFVTDSQSYLEIRGFCPPTMYRTSHDRPAPFGLGFGNGSESGGIMPIGQGDKLQEIMFYGANSGPTIFTWKRQLWEGTNQQSTTSNYYSATMMSLDSSNGNLYVRGTVTAGGTIATNNGYLVSTLNGNTVTIGSNNSSWMHFSNSANIPFLFNNGITVQGNLRSYGDCSYNLGDAAYEWGEGRIRCVSTRHLDASHNYTGDHDLYIGYGSATPTTNTYLYTSSPTRTLIATINSRGVTVNSGSLTVNGNISLNNVGSINHIAIGGGIYWNPYVESATDGTDAASITLLSSGPSGGTTLCISQSNDWNDTIQFSTNASSSLYHNDKKIATQYNTYVSDGKGYLFNTEITQVNNADTLDGYHQSSFCKQVVLGWYSDYTYYVVGLCQITDYTVEGNNASGTISVGRDNGIYNRSLIHYSIQTAYNTTNVYFNYSYLGESLFEPCTFTYNSKKWAGFVFRAGTASTNYVLIQNHYSSRNTNAFFIHYYNTRDGVLNAEINGSLSINGSDITIGSMATRGNMYAAHFYENSDIRYKRVLNNLTASSRQLASLPLFDFEWIDGNILGTGTSAQEVQKILPNIVDGEEKLTLDYGVLGTISGVIACREIEEIKPEIEVLKQRIKELENQLNKH